MSIWSQEKKVSIHTRAAFIDIINAKIKPFEENVNTCGLANTIADAIIREIELEENKKVNPQ